MACDICTDNVRKLVQLKKPYQTDDIKQICTACEKDINKQLLRLDAFTLKLRNGLLVRFIKALRLKRNKYLRI